jgi:hypothetical protein
VTSEFRKLVEMEVLGFIDFVNDKGYFLQNYEDENNRITYEFLQLLLQEYLNKGEGEIDIEC